MTYDRKDPNEVLAHAQEATWEDGQRLGLKTRTSPIVRMGGIPRL